MCVLELFLEPFQTGQPLPPTFATEEGAQDEGNLFGFSVLKAFVEFKFLNSVHIFVLLAVSILCPTFLDIGASTNGAAIRTGPLCSCVSDGCD